MISSLASVSEAGYRDAYFAALPEKHHETVRSAVAATWLPADLAVAHYGACSSLGLSHDAVARIGRSVGDKVSGTLVGTAARISREMGVTPLEVIPQFQRFWGRAFQGGGCCAFKIGPKEVSLEAHKAVVFDYPYFRSAICGLLMGVLEPFCTRVYVSERPGQRPPAGGLFKIQWV